MFGDRMIHSVTFDVAYDPAADQVYPLFRAPQALEIVGAYVTVVDDVGASTANYFTVVLYNGGAAGTATTSLATGGGGTAAWVGLTPDTLTIAEGTLAAGEVVTAKVDETGTGTFGQMTIQLDYKLGEID